MASLHQVSIGFDGGQVLSVRVPDEQLAALRDALAGGGWHELLADDGTVRLNLAHVAYVRTESEEHRVGFGV